MDFTYTSRFDIRKYSREYTSIKKIERFSYDLEKWFRFRFLFYQPMDEKIKTWTYQIL